MANGKESDEGREIERLRIHLLQHLNWGEVANWHSSMFTELSNRIFEECQVMLSAATLKRFWGVVKHEGTPSTSTLDTLAKFGGFSNWRDFKLSGGDSNTQTPTHFPKKTLYVSAGFLIAIVVIGLIGSKRALDPDELATISFSSRPVTNSYPNSVVFDFDLKNIRSNNLKIQQYWDPDKTITLKPEQRQATGIYYFPGYFKAKLLVDGEVIKEHELFLRSQGWIGTLDYQPIPKYFVPKQVAPEGMSSTSTIYEEVITQKNPISTTFHYVNELGNISGDNFTLSSSIKIGWSEKWGVCQVARIYILGSDGAMIFPFSKIGCSSNNGLMLNDVFLNGKEHDLSFFGTDLSDFTDIKLEVKDKKATVFINGSEVYSGEYTETMGRVVGLRFKFLGVGEVASFSLSDQQSETVLELP